MYAKVTSLIATLFLICCFACGPSENSTGETIGGAMPATGNPAIDGLSSDIAVSPDDADLYARRGALLYENGAFDPAIEDLRRAIQLDSTQVSYRHLLADIYLDYYRSREALETLESAARDFPERIPTLLKLSEFQLILKQHEASMRTLDRILQIDPQEPEAFFMFGMNFKETGDTARAINSFQEAVELDAGLIDGWINLGQLQAAVGNSIAERYFNTALEIDPRYIPAIHAKADYLRDQERLTEAIELYKSISLIDTQYEEAYFNSGLLLMELDSFEQAYRQFDLALQVAPAHVRAYYFRGLASELSGRTDRARADYEQALRFAPDYEEAREGLRRLQGTQ